MTLTSNTVSNRFDFFVSYASINVRPVERLVERLKNDGYTVWFDKEQMGAGKTTLGQLVDAINNSNHMIVCLSDPYLERDWTLTELQVNINLDPAQQSNRTLPVLIEPITKALPNQIQHITYADLSDPAHYEDGYAKLLRNVKSNVVETFSPDDYFENLQNLSKSALDPQNEPIAALVKVRLAVIALLEFLYRVEVKREPPNKNHLEIMVRNLTELGSIPVDIKIVLSSIQTYGNWELDDLMGLDVRPELVQPALSALSLLSDWVFVRYFQQPIDQNRWEKIIDMLPNGNSKAEKSIPETKYIIQIPATGMNSLGPLFIGINSLGEQVSINLACVSEHQTDILSEEIGQVSRLNNAHIVKPWEMGDIRIQDRPQCKYIVLEHINGANAQDLMNHFGKLPELAVYELGRQVAIALEGFHTASEQIIHGDIKPSNIIVDRYGHCKVLCIGRNSGLRLGVSQASVGTVDSIMFASPEQKSGKDLTHQTDIFALRAMLYYLLTGEYESSQTNLEDALSASASNLLQSLASSTTAQQARFELEKVIQKNLDKGTNLESTIRKFLNLPASATAVSTKVSVSQDFAEVASYPIDCHEAWIAGNYTVLVRELSSELLSLYKGSELVWRDSKSIPVRQIVRGDDDRLIATGWEGQIRVFEHGKHLVSHQIQGTIGGANYGSGSWIVGSWKTDLISISDSGEIKPLLAVNDGVFRIATMKGSNRFAVVNLKGSVSLFSDFNRVATFPPPPQGQISSIGFTGRNLIAMVGKNLHTYGFNGQKSAPERSPGGNTDSWIVPSPDGTSCLLVTRTGKSWIVDDLGRHIPYFEFGEDRSIVTTCEKPKRFTLELSTGGLEYWRDGKLIETWENARTATLSSDGHTVVVTLPNEVKVYHDPY